MCLRVGFSRTIAGQQELVKQIEFIDEKCLLMKCYPCFKELVGNSEYEISGIGAAKTYKQYIKDYIEMVKDVLLCGN
jgi:hypothetical protein